MKKSFKKLLVGVLAFGSLSSMAYASDDPYSAFMHGPYFDTNS